MRALRFIKNWALPLAMLVGAANYFIYVNIPFLLPTRPFVNAAVTVVQPTLLFLMLYFTFCNVTLKELRLCRWHGWLLLFQGGLFTLVSLLVALLPHNGWRVVLEGAAICLICPTATAGAVITRKLGGRPADLTTYLVMANLLTALLVPAFVPLVHPHPQLSAFASFLLIMGKVFPLLLCPLLLALLTQRLLPRLHACFAACKDVGFYLWVVSLSLAITVTVKSIVHTHVGIDTQLGLAAASLLSCLVQFWFGRKMGGRYGDAITAGQSLGQKNTVFAIWMGYTFFTPVTAITGGFYSVWHNTVNSYQLYRKRKNDEQGAAASAKQERELL